MYLILGALYNYSRKSEWSMMHMRVLLCICIPEQCLVTMVIGTIESVHMESLTICNPVGRVMV